MYLIPNSFVAIVHSLGIHSRAIKIKISTQSTPNRYFEIGSLVVGNIIIPQQYGRGRTISFEEVHKAKLHKTGLNAFEERTQEGAPFAFLGARESIRANYIKVQRIPTITHYPPPPGLNRLGCLTRPLLQWQE